MTVMEMHELMERLLNINHKTLAYKSYDRHELMATSLLKHVFMLT